MFPNRKLLIYDYRAYGPNKKIQLQKCRKGLEISCSDLIIQVIPRSENTFESGTTSTAAPYRDIYRHRATNLRDERFEMGNSCPRIILAMIGRSA